MKVHFDDNGYYLCNYALGPYVKRKTKNIMDVTCINCNIKLARGRSSEKKIKRLQCRDCMDRNTDRCNFQCPEYRLKEFLNPPESSFTVLVKK